MRGLLRGSILSAHSAVHVFEQQISSEGDR